MLLACAPEWMACSVSSAPSRLLLRARASSLAVSKTPRSRDQNIWSWSRPGSVLDVTPCSRASWAYPSCWRARSAKGLAISTRVVSRSARLDRMATPVACAGSVLAAPRAPISRSVCRGCCPAGLQLVVDRGGGVGGVPQLLGELLRSGLDGAQCRTARVGIEQDLGGVPARVVDSVLVVPQRPLQRCGLFHRGVQEISGVVEPPADGRQDASCLLAHRGPPPSGTLSWPSWLPRRLLS